MKRNKLIAVCLFTSMILVYNVTIKRQMDKEVGVDITAEDMEQAVVNLSIFFFVTLYGYVVYTLFENRGKIVSRFDTYILHAFGWFWCIPILLNLICINQTWEGYNNITSNWVIDLFSFLFLATIITLLICQKLKVIRF